MKHILLIVIGLSASLLKGQGLWPLQSPAGVVAYAGSLQWGPDGLLYTMIGSDGAVPIGQDTLDFVGTGWERMLVGLDSLGSLRRVLPLADQQNNMEMDFLVGPDSNFYVFGKTSDPGNMIGGVPVPWQGDGCAYIAKLDTMGSALWVRTFPQVNATATIADVHVAASGTVFFHGTVFHDTGLIGSVELGDTLVPVTSGTSQRHFIAAMDQQGQVIWVRHGNNGTAIRGMTYNGTDGLYLCGEKGINPDLGMLPPYLIAAYGYVLEMDTSGNTVDFTLMSLEPRSVAVDGAGNSYVGGIRGNSAVRVTDPMGTVIQFPGSGPDVTSMCVMKIGPAGGALWIAGGLEPLLNAVTHPLVAVDDAGQVYMGGASGTMRFDDLFVVKDGDATFSIARYSPNGELLGLFPGSNTCNWSLLRGLVFDATGNVIVSAILTEGSMIIGGDTLVHGTGSFFITKMQVNDKGSNLVTGDLFHDIDLDGQFSAGDTLLSAWGITSGTYGSLSITDPQGQYALVVDTGSYTIAPMLPADYYWYVTHPSIGYQTAQLPTSPLVIGGFDLGVAQVPNVSDLRCDIVPMGAARPGFSTAYHLLLKNVGTVDQSVTMCLRMDSSLTLTTAEVIPSAVFTDSLVWNIGALAVGQEVDYTLVFDVDPDVDLLGTYLENVLTALPVANDTTPMNNADTLHHLVTGSYDPNDKIVEPDTTVDGATVSGGRLDYTIRFQNTGTDTAFTVVLIDTLPAGLEMNSWQFMSSSHPCSIKIRDGNILSALFADIHLPDSTTDFVGSQGYFKFSVWSQPGLAVGTQIRNQANIFFDFNSPVATGLTLNTIVGSSAGTGTLPHVVGGVILYPNPVAHGRTVALKALPNGSAHVFSLFDANGRLISSQLITPQNHEQQLEVPASSGTYLYRLTEDTNAVKASGQLVVR